MLDGHATAQHNQSSERPERALQDATRSLSLPVLTPLLLSIWTFALMKVLRVNSLIVVFLLVSCLPPAAQAQLGKWRRVFTGEDFVVDVNPTSLSFEPGRVLRAQFRTILSKPETIGTTKYKTRLETIDFKTDRRYRYYETSLLDSAGKVVQSSEPNSSQDWKFSKDGVVTERLFQAARSLPPLGLWKVVGYRYAEGTFKGTDEPPELTKLVGTLVRLDVDAAEVGMQRCSAPAYRSQGLTDDAFFHELGTSLAMLGVKETQVDTINLKCEKPEWSPPRSLILQLTSGRLLMLWKGVFLQLKKYRISYRNRNSKLVNNTIGAVHQYHPRERVDQGIGSSLRPSGAFRSLARQRREFPESL
jgi:hypothetical protein